MRIINALKPLLLPIGAFAGVLIALTLIGKSSQTSTIRSLESQLKSTQDSLVTWKLKSGATVTQTTTAVIDQNTLELAYAPLLEKLRKELDIKQKDIKAYVKAEIATISAGQGTSVYNEAARSYSVYDTTRWFMISGTVDTLGFKYSYVHLDELQFVQHDVRRLFKPTLSKITVTTANPATRLSGLTSFTVKQKPKRFHLGPQITYDFTTVRFGVGLSYSLLSF